MAAHLEQKLYVAHDSVVQVLYLIYLTVSSAGSAAANKACEPTSKQKQCIDRHHGALPHKQLAGGHHVSVHKPATVKPANIEVDTAGMDEDPTCACSSGVSNPHQT